ncbi:sodium/solute symporter [Dunaliella salina]|uniref:Sodium/solute symporter n=1 Tax=Dunaliella salina TaxID=3046 RepID=A0ABQ7GSC3_DUNSA|nr:sodium/solute symporter [Dunaliella salina]|eukprot:KAF5837517.1 sodium/solute symporter [Dunaliella salina]
MAGQDGPSENMLVGYIVLGIYILLLVGSGMLAAIVNWVFRRKDPQGSLMRNHFMAGTGLGSMAWFFTMASSLFSGYSVSGISSEAYGLGFVATRWIPAGIGLYCGFMFLAPRCYALSKQRGFMTLGGLIFERYLPPAGHPWCAHALRLLAFGVLSLVGCHLCGSTGLTSGFFSSLHQAGSIVFLVLQYTELGGLPTAWRYWSDPDNRQEPLVGNMQLIPSEVSTVAYFDFLFKTTVAATMFPHLWQRLFCASSSRVVKNGLAAMNLTFFVVQFASMVIGWVAIAAFSDLELPTPSPFGSLLRLIAKNGPGQSFASALLLASGVCAMMSTADSSLLAFSTMWVQDFLRPYVWPSASELVQMLFAKFMGFVALCIGIALAILSIRDGKPDLTGLFSLQNVTPIHVAPAVWLGMHWRGLRAEAVLTGMVCGLGVTVGMVFSEKNVMYDRGLDRTENGLSTAWIGFCVNFFVTVTMGLILQFGPRVYPKLAELLTQEIHKRSIDIGPVHDPLIHPKYMVPFFLLLLFCVPFYREHLTPDTYVGSMASWAFTSLFLSGILALASAAVYKWAWRDYEPLPLPELPETDPSSKGKTLAGDSSLDEDALAISKLKESSGNPIAQVALTTAGTPKE